MTYEDDRYHCDRCGSDLCDECCLSCQGCERGLCSDCMSTCAVRRGLLQRLPGGLPDVPRELLPELPGRRPLRELP